MRKTGLRVSLCELQTGAGGPFPEIGKFPQTGLRGYLRSILNSQYSQGGNSLEKDAENYLILQGQALDYLSLGAQFRRKRERNKDETGGAAPGGDRDLRIG